MSDRISAPQASAPPEGAPRQWPGWAAALLAVGYWAALTAGATIAGEFAARALCWRRLGLWWSARCADPRGESFVGLLLLLPLGGVGFFAGSAEFDGWARLYYLAAYLTALLAWAAAVAFVPELPLVVQLAVPLALVVVLKRHVRRAQAAAANSGSGAPRG